jgi:uncharacterized cupin superfamily protein
VTQPRIVRFEPKGPGGKGLELWEEIAEAGLIAGKPVQHGHYYLNDPASVTILDERGGSTTVKAGESFILPKGLPCAWKQTGYVRKFFVIFDDSSGLKPEDPAALKVLRPDPKTPLERSASPSPDVLLSSVPTQHAREYFEDLSGQWTVGIWDSTPYHRKTINFPRHELMHILEGEVTITEEGFAPQTFKAGDSFFVPMGTRCDWHTTRYIRKIYCIMQPRQAAAASAAAE